MRHILFSQPRIGLIFSLENIKVGDELLYYEDAVCEVFGYHFSTLYLQIDEIKKHQQELQCTLTETRDIDGLVTLRFI